MFRYASWVCYDGTEFKEGGETSCKSSETWRQHAEEACKLKCVEVETLHTPGEIEPAIQQVKCGLNSFKVWDECGNDVCEVGVNYSSPDCSCPEGYAMKKWWPMYAQNAVYSCDTCRDTDGGKDYYEKGTVSGLETADASSWSTTRTSSPQSRRPHTRIRACTDDMLSN